MSLRMTTLVGVVGLLLAGGVAARAQDDEAKAQAQTSAKSWLAVLDAQEYDRTWQESGGMLKGAVTQDEWTRKLAATLGPLGQVKSRSVRSAEYSTTMPGAPDGEYVVVIFDTVFKNKQSAVETVPLVKEDDGFWRVSGYWIR